MKNNIFRIIHNLIKKSPTKDKIKNSSYHDSSTEKKLLVFSNDLENNINILTSYLGESDDIDYRVFQVATLPSIRATLVFIESLVDEKTIESSVLAPLLQGLQEKTAEERASMSCDINALVEKTLINCKTSFIDSPSTAADEVLSGKGVLLIHESSRAISLHVSKGASKEFATPESEKVIHGPQQSFVESILSNISMIRNRIKSPHLVIKGLEIGRHSKTQVRVVYMNNIVDLSIVQEVFKRLESIDVDGIAGSQNIEEYITDTPTNLIPTIFSTERPDRVQTMLLEGRVAILCDQDPFVLIAPSIVSDFLSSSEDYYSNYYFATFNRILSYIGVFAVMFLPALYIALSTFHQEMIPTRLALTLAGTRSGVPYPAFVETLIMEIAFEGLREASTRLPTHIGEAVGIVGALIIGQASVEAGLVSPAVVIIVATTAIFSFTIPYNNFSTALRLTRFFNMTLASILGIYGIMTGGLIILLNLVSLRSFGIPFMTPLAPLNLRGIKDLVLRFPQWSLVKRPSSIVNRNINKKSDDLKPHPSNDEGR